MLQNAPEYPCKWMLVVTRVTRVLDLLVIIANNKLYNFLTYMHYPELHAGLLQARWTKVLQDLCIFSSFRLSEVLTSSASTVIPQFTVCVQNAHNTSCHWTDKHNKERGLVMAGLNDLLWGWTHFIKVFIKKSSQLNYQKTQTPLG